MVEKNIGEVITEAREKANLSQRQLAKLANINNSELSKIESGVRKEPSPKILRKISNVLDVNYSDLMYMIGLGIEVSPLNPFIKEAYLIKYSDNAIGTILIELSLCNSLSISKQPLYLQCPSVYSAI